MTVRIGRQLAATVFAIGTAFVIPQPAAAVDSDNAQQVEANAPAIQVAAAKAREIVETLSLTGTLMPRNEASAGADVAGLKVLELLADRGDIVKAGQVLARLDRAALDVALLKIDAQRAQANAAIAQAEAQIASAEVGVRQANDQFERAEQLFERKIAAKAQRDDAKNALDSAKAQLKTAQEGLAAARAQIASIDAQEAEIRLNISKTEVTAPVSGLVLSRNAQMGSIVSVAAGPLFRIAEEAEFEAVLQIPETDIARVQPGMKAIVSVAGRDEPLQAEVRSVDPEVDAQTRLGKVRVVLPGEADVHPGMFARATVETLRRTGVAVPVAALLYREGSAYLQVVKSGVVESRPVETGARSDGFVEITTGLSEGEEFVARAGTFVADGDRIRPIMAEDTTGATGK